MPDSNLPSSRTIAENLVGAALWRTSVVGFGIVLAALTQFVLPWQTVGRMEAAFVFFAWLVQALSISAVLFVFAGVTGYLERRRGRGRWFGRAMSFLYAVLATLIATVLLADVRIHQLYGFHINGFVVNLVTTPGGLASMEASTGTWVTVGIIIGVIFLVLAGFVTWMRHRSPRWGSTRRPRLRWSVAIAIIVVILVDKGLYGYADLSGDGAVLRASGLFPFYQPVTFRSFAKRLGIEPAPVLIQGISQRGTLAYPRVPIEIQPRLGAAPPNVLWLTAESMRWDLLTPTTMPRLWAFAADNLRFTHHFSGGNRTRMGMFTQFYSLHGPYWSHVLEQRRAPVLFDVLERLDYNTEVFTSAKFSYPEFDHTIFVGVPADRRHEYSEDEVFWHRDVYNVDQLIASLERRDRSRPFMRFMFFESTHAPYQFPEEDAIATPYGVALNYALMDPARDIELIRNRYVNAAHFVDSQIGRLLDYLEAEGQIESTIVIVTGDHGEELLEHGRWGHGSAFVDEQVRVPLVMRIPGQPARVIDTVTSHLDIVPSVLPALGVVNPPADYGLGADVVRGVPDRQKIIVSEWSGFAYIDAQYVATIPLSGGFDADVHRRSDYTTVPALAFFQSHAEQLAQVMREMHLFLTDTAGTNTSTGDRDR